MESIYAHQKRYGTTLQTDRSAGMRYGTPAIGSSRPVRSGLGEDLGHDFGGRVTKAVAKTKKRGGGKRLKGPGEDSMEDSIDWSIDTSGDELDVISPDKSTSQAWGHTSDVLKAEMKGVATLVKGQLHPYDPKYSAKPKLPNFKKNKPKSSADFEMAPSSSAPSQEALVDGETYRFPSSSKTERRDPGPSQKQTRPKALPQRACGTNSTELAARPYKAPTRVAPPSQVRLSSASASSSKSLLSSLDEATSHAKPVRDRPNEVMPRTLAARPFPIGIDDKEEKKVEDSTPRPRPNPRVAGTGPKPGKNQNPFSWPSPLSEETPKAKVRSRSPTWKPSDSEAIDLESSDDDMASKRKDKGKKKMEARPFPLDEMSPLKKTSAGSRKQSKPPSARNLKEFPALSPLSTSRKKSGALKNRTRASGGVVYSSSELSESSADEAPLKPSIRAFPLDSQFLRSLGNSPSPGKRASEGSDPDDVSRSNRKRRRKNSGDVLSNMPVDEDEDAVFDSDLHFFDPRVDPSTLCPWCDEPLPKAPSPWLITLIASVRQKSISDPRPTNPQGVWASPTVYAHVCARHAFEDQHIPMAEAKGWPTRIQWSEVGNRIVAMKERLQAIIDDVDEEFIPGRQKVGEEANRTEADKPVADDWEDEELQQARPRKGSVFWRDVVKNVRQQGSKQASGVRGQFSSFEKTQPGYYGELGFVIISQTIYDLFPPHSLDSDSTLPLIPSEFLQLILIPEAAVGLIMEDMNQSRKASIKTLRESAEYGVAMFPDEGGTNVGENIVRQRAKNRRKALGDEGHAEEDDNVSESGVSDVGATTAPAKRRGRPPKKPQSVVDSSDCDVPKSSQGRQTRKASSSNLSSKPSSSNITSKPSSSNVSIKPTRLKKTNSELQDVIMISDSTDSAAPPPAPAQPRPRPTWNPKPKIAPTPLQAGLLQLPTIDLCESSDFSDVLAVENHLSHPRNLTPFSEKEISDEGPKGSDTDIDLDVEEPPASSLTAPTMREVTWDTDGKHHIRERSSSVAPQSDGEAGGTTPKKRRTFSRTSSTSSVIAVVGPSSSSGGVLPLDLARKRSAANTLIIEKGVRKASSSGPWLTNMDDVPEEIDDSL